MAVRGKFTVVERTKFTWSPTMERVVFSAEYDTANIPEDQRYATATPSGRIEMNVDSPGALAQFTLGQKFYVDFTPVE